MRQKHFIHWIMSILALAVLIAADCDAVAAEALDTAAVLAEAKASLQADRQLLDKARLRGRFEIMGKDGTASKLMFTNFECWLWGEQLRNNSYCDLKWSTFPYAKFQDVHSLLLKDGSLFVTSFSKHFKPAGCQTRVTRYESDMLFHTHYTVWEHPATLLTLPFDPTREGIESMTFTKDNNGILYGTYHPRKNIRCDIQLDSNIGNRPIASKIYIKDKLVHDIRAKWKPWPGVGLMMESLENTSTAENATYLWTLTELEPLKAIDPNKFQQADLGALPGGRVIDERDSNKVLINGKPIR